jgi:hypothetical protein
MKTYELKSTLQIIFFNQTNKPIKKFKTDNHNQKKNSNSNLLQANDEMILGYLNQGC